MCLAIPGKIIKFVDENNAIVKFGGSEIQINLSFVENAKLDDYVIAHSGFALSLLDVEEAEKTLSVWREYEESMGEVNSW